MALTTHQEKIIRDQYKELMNIMIECNNEYLELLITVMQLNELQTFTCDAHFTNFAREAFVRNSEAIIEEEHLLRIANDIITP